MAKNLPYIKIIFILKLRRNHSKILFPILFAHWSEWRGGGGGVISPFSLSYFFFFAHLMVDSLSGHGDDFTSKSLFHKITIEDV